MYKIFSFVYTSVCYFCGNYLIGAILFILNFRGRLLFPIFTKKRMDLTQEEWTAQLAQDDNAVIIDVRTPEEWSEGIIPNALQIDLYQGQGFIYKVDELDKSKNYYVYCKAGGRSSHACNIMNQLGFENTYNLVGGFMQWIGEVVVPE
jgi:rhodanese-related sulfurtransferase